MSSLFHFLAPGSKLILRPLISKSDSFLLSQYNQDESNKSQSSSKHGPSRHIRDRITGIGIGSNYSAAITHTIEMHAYRFISGRAGKDMKS